MQWRALTFLGGEALLKAKAHVMISNWKETKYLDVYSHENMQTWQLRPWPNDSIFHSIFSSTFYLKVERLLSVVKHRWPNGSIFRSTFLSTFQLLIFPQRVSAKNIYHHKYLTA